jgi:hypothetical protein
MSFIRHVGKHGDRKVAIIFREVPNEPHMCLVTYTETLNRHMHDPMMKTIESDIGQNSANLADALNRSYTTDGKFMLQTLHQEGLLKKVQTSQVVMTPNSQTSIRLDELNKMLNEMELGEAAVKRLAELDSSLGIQDPAQVARKLRTPAVVGEGALGDAAIAAQRLAQAQRMESEARGLLAESQRLMEEAKTIDPSLGQPILPVVKKRGRPAKAKATA